MKAALATRRHPAYLAFLVHRLSGLALALFLPLHLLVLGLAIEGEAALDGFLRWTEHPVVRLSEGLLVVLLTVHLAGGLRLLVGELIAWRPGQTGLIWTAFGLACLAGLGYLLLL